MVAQLEVLAEQLHSVLLRRWVVLEARQVLGRLLVCLRQAELVEWVLRAIAKGWVR